VRRGVKVTVLLGLLALLALVTAILVPATAWLLRDPSGNEPGGAAAPQHDTEDSGAAPRASTSGRLRCWDGAVAARAAACPVPSGLRGLLWVYPSFEQDRAVCRRVTRPLTPRKVLVYFCPFTADNPDEGIRYSEWVSAAAAREVITRDFFWPEVGVERDGYTWSVWVRESADEQGWFSSAVAYRDWPFSAEVQSNTRRASILGCNFIELRVPDTFRRVTSLCEAD
jgi:hypothetical protein